MYLFLGGTSVIKTDEIIGVFDLDNTTVSKRTRDFLAAAEKRGIVEYTSYDLPKAFVVCKKKDENKIYVTAVSAATLKKRLQERAQRNIDEI